MHSSSHLVGPKREQRVIGKMEAQKTLLACLTATQETMALPMAVHRVVPGQIKRNKILQDGQKAPSDSVGFPESVSTGPSTLRKSVDSSPSRFLGRHPPPFQRRSTSLPRIDKWKPPHPPRCHPPMQFASPPRRVYDQLLLLALAGLSESTFMN